MSAASPLRSWQSSITAPTNSLGAMIDAVMNGSRISAIVPGSGMSEGLWTSISSPFVSVTSNSTEGIVASSSRSYSRSRRSRTMSMCNRPRNPHRNPNPSASEVSGSQLSAASLSVSFSSASRRSGYSSELIGNRPQNTIGLTSR